MRILFVFHSKYGQTAKIAGYMADIAEQQGWFTKLVGIDDLTPSIRVEDFDAVVIGCPIYVSKYSKQVANFIQSHHDALAKTHSMFFSVSMAAASNPHEQAEARALMETFVAHSGWQPAVMTSIAGAVNYRDYGWITRWVMKRISAKRGGSTDTSKNHEYTDWNQVDSITQEFLQLANRANQPAAGVSAEPTGTN